MTTRGKEQLQQAVAFAAPQHRLQAQSSALPDIPPASHHTWQGSSVLTILAVTLLLWDMGNKLRDWCLLVGSGDA